MPAPPQSDDDPEREAAHRAPSLGLRERVGAWIGRLWAPVIAQISHARHARMVHPDGLTLAGHVVPVTGEHAALADAFAGRVLVRCSAARWRGGEHLDVLGFALRVRRGQGVARDAQRYWAVSPFAYRGQRYELRVSPMMPPPRPVVKPPRAARLLAAVHAQRAIWQLEARATLPRGWQPIARITLEAIRRAASRARS